MTSLIDVIFLLLLFFMLSSTFSKFAEVDLAGQAGPGNDAEGEVMFLQVTANAMRLNTASIDVADLSSRLAAPAGQDSPRVLLSLSEDVTSQRLTDVLVILRARPDLRLSILAPT